MINVNIDLDQRASDALQKQLARYASAIGSHAETASRRCAIMICKSLRKNTKLAKKNKKIGISKDNTMPGRKYISYSHGKKLDVPLRRYKVELASRGRTVIRYADPAKYKQEIRKSTGTNWKPEEKRGGVRGLAKRSWGWVMHRIFASGNPDLPFDRRQKDTRNPKDATKDSMSSSRKTAAETSSYSRISNKLDYILDALKGYTPQNAIDTAMRWMEREIQRLTSF